MLEIQGRRYNCMKFILRIIVFLFFNLKKLYNVIGAKGMENHKLDKLLTWEELLFL